MSFKNWLLSLVRGKAITNAVKSYRVGISPGHGGEDPGAIGADGSHEASLARIFADSLYIHMKQNSIFSPVLYGMSEVKKNYPQRIEDSDANRDMFYMPCHFNACTDPRKNGWLVLIDPEDGKQNPNLYGLATSIALELQTFTPLGYADWDTKKDGAMAGDGRPIYELTKPKALTIYLELGFISNPDWCMKLKQHVFMFGIAEAVVKGMEKYLNLVEFK